MEPARAGPPHPPWDATTTRGDTDDFGKTLYRDEDADVVATLGKVAERRGVSMAQAGLAWLLAQPAVTSPIVGVTKQEHLDQSLASVDVELTEDDLEELRAKLF